MDFGFFLSYFPHEIPFTDPSLHNPTFFTDWRRYGDDAIIAAVTPCPARSRSRTVELCGGAAD